LGASLGIGVFRTSRNLKGRLLCRFLNTNVLNAIPNLKNWFSARQARAAFIALIAIRRKSRDSFPVLAAFHVAATVAPAR
jgi:hypothetical protein